jgi:NAD-dependent deacetylase
MKPKIVILSGAGISAESGIKTFRDADGLWEGHDVMEVATPQGFAKNPALVLEFYNQRRRQLNEVKPNLAHEIIAQLEKDFEVVIITQNVDNLHERAGSTKVLHLHGELTKSRGVSYPQFIYDQQGDILLGDTCPNGTQLRPHIVWFGEDVPMIETAIDHVEIADIVVVIGTSLQVYPAASLMNYAPPHAPIFYIDKNPAEINDFYTKQRLTIKQGNASDGMIWFQNEVNLLFNKSNP